MLWQLFLVEEHEFFHRCVTKPLCNALTLMEVTTSIQHMASNDYTDHLLRPAWVSLNPFLSPTNFKSA